MKNESIVVYSSEFERMQDEYWMDFLSNHAEFILYFNNILIFLVVTVFFMVFKSIFKKK